MESHESQKATSGTVSTKISRKPHCRQGVQLNESFWYATFFLCRRLRKSRLQKAAVDKEWNKLETISAWQLIKVNSKKRRSSNRHKKTKGKSTLLMLDMCHFKNSELEPRFQKYKCRVAPRATFTRRLWCLCSVY